MQEQFSYSLMASGLGILIVFSILLLLCGLMILIRKLSEPGTQAKTAPSAPVKSAAPAAAKTKPGLPLPVLVAAATAATSAGGLEWIAAATAAFLASEDDASSGPSASVWTSDKYNRFDPWVANNKLSKTVPGV